VSLDTAWKQKFVIPESIKDQELIAHACNPSHLGGRDWKDHSLRSARANSSRTLISTNSWSWWHTSVIPATAGRVNRNVTVHAGPGKKQDRHLQNNQSKKNWRCGLPGKDLPSKHKVLSLNPATTKNTTTFMLTEKNLINGIVFLLLF
jgi:hypothetical protein